MEWPLKNYLITPSCQFYYQPFQYILKFAFYSLSSTLLPPFLGTNSLSVLMCRWTLHKTSNVGAHQACYPLGACKVISISKGVNGSAFIMALTHGALHVCVTWTSTNLSVAESSHNLLILLEKEFKYRITSLTFSSSSLFISLSDEDPRREFCYPTIKRGYKGLLHWAIFILLLILWFECLNLHRLLLLVLLLNESHYRGVKSEDC